MHIAVFGGTGLAGAPLLDQLLGAGHGVTVLARTPTSVPDRENVTVVSGDARVYDDVAATIVGCNAVVSTLGGFGDSDATRIGTRNIVEAMRQSGVRRLVVLQGFHLDLPGDPGGLGRRLVGAYLRLADRRLVPDTQAMADHLIAQADIAWILLRIPILKDAGPTGRIETGLLNLGPWSTVTAGDVAVTMLDLLTNPTSVHQAPMIRSA